MKVKEISASKTVSVVANFQKIEVRFSATGEVSPKADAEVEAADLQEYVDTQVMGMVEKAVEEVKALGGK